MNVLLMERGRWGEKNLGVLRQLRVELWVADFPDGRQGVRGLTLLALLATYALRREPARDPPPAAVAVGAHRKEPFKQYGRLSIDPDTDPLR